MTEITLDGLHYSWNPDTTTLMVSETRCFDPALEPTAREIRPTDWIEVGGRSIPVVSVNSHDREAVMLAYIEAIQQEMLD
jgi:hypothetical protein